MVQAQNRKFIQGIGLKSKFFWTVLCVCLALVIWNPVSVASPVQSPYADYEALSKYESETIEDESTISNLIHLLPMLDNYGDFWFDFDASTAPYSLRIYYEDFNIEMPWLPYSQFTKDSNALLLFRYIHNLEQISLYFYSGDTSVSEERDQRKYEMHATYHRQDFETLYGDLNQLSALDLDSILRANRAIDDSAHYNRVRWGSPEEWVLYRNSDPDMIKKDSNGLIEIDYHDAGSKHAVRFLLNDPKCVDKGLNGVCQIHVVGWDSEISWHCGLASDNVQIMLEILGEPQSSIALQNGSYRYMYPVYGQSDQKYIYFDCQNGRIVAHGLGYGPGIQS